MIKNSSLLDCVFEKDMITPTKFTFLFRGNNYYKFQHEADDLEAFNLIVKTLLKHQCFNIQVKYDVCSTQIIMTSILNSDNVEGWVYYFNDKALKEILKSNLIVECLVSTNDWQGKLNSNLIIIDCWEIDDGGVG